MPATFARNALPAQAPTQGPAESASYNKVAPISQLARLDFLTPRMTAPYDALLGHTPN
jgi:hypothetical protein